MALVRALDSGRELPVDGGEIGTGDDGDADAQSEQRLQLRLDHDVLQARGGEDREHRRRRSVGPAHDPGPGLQPVGVEPVLDDEQAGVVPDETGRLVVDRRGEADRPRARGAVDAELRSTELLERGRDERPEVLEASAGFRQGKDGRPLAAALMGTILALGIVLPVVILGLLLR